MKILINKNKLIIGYIAGIIKQKDNQKNMDGIEHSLFGDEDIVLSN